MVGVAVGIITVGISVGGGNGLILMRGLTNTITANAPMHSVEIKPNMERTSQNVFFILLHSFFYFLNLDTHNTTRVWYHSIGSGSGLGVIGVLDFVRVRVKVIVRVLVGVGVLDGV